MTVHASLFGNAFCKRGYSVILYVLSCILVHPRDTDSGTSVLVACENVRYLQEATLCKKKLLDNVMSPFKLKRSRREY